MRYFILSTIFLFSIYTYGQSTTFFLVRHAEKVDNNQDAALSEKGLVRSKKLSKLLSEAGITKVFSTNYKRTKDTVNLLLTRWD